MIALQSGTLPGWLTLIALLGGAWILIRGGTPGAISGLRDTNRELARQLHEARDRILDLETEVKLLQGKTDLTAALAPLMSWAAQHEDAAQKRTDSILGIMQMISVKLGPDENGD